MSTNTLNNRQKKLLQQQLAGALAQNTNKLAQVPREHQLAGSAPQIQGGTGFAAQNQSFEIFAFDDPLNENIIMSKQDEHPM